MTEPSPAIVTLSLALPATPNFAKHAFAASTTGFMASRITGAVSCATSGALALPGAIAPHCFAFGAMGPEAGLAITTLPSHGDTTR